MISDLEAMRKSVEQDAAPPAGLSDELRSLWHAKKGEWHSAHDIAQEIDTQMGSWIHALLHLIEGDLGNAGYWYARAGKPARKPEEIEESWDELVLANLSV
jgi:hypothetical protein